MEPDLDRLRVASPCHAAWNEMGGNDQVRFCSDCRLNVYNFHAMSRDEIADLIQGSEGRLCARMYQRRDGTLITRDCPRGRRAIATKRLSLVGLFFTIYGLALSTVGRKSAEPEDRGYVPPPTAPTCVEPMRSWPVIGEVVEKIWPEPKVVMGALPIATPMPSKTIGP